MSKVEWAVYTFFAKGCKKVAEQNLDGAERIDVLPVGFDEFVERVLDKDFGDMELKIKLFEAKLDQSKMDEIRRMMFE